MNSNVMGEGGPPVCVTSVALRVPGWLMMGISLCGNDATRFTGGSEAVGWATLGSQLEERQARAGFRHDALTPPAPASARAAPPRPPPGPRAPPPPPRATPPPPAAPGARPRSPRRRSL